VFRPDFGGVIAAGQGGRRRSVQQFGFQHGVWTARHADSAGENHDRRGRCIHADRAALIIARNQRHPLSFIRWSSRRAATDAYGPGNPGCAHADALLHCDYAFATTFEMKIAEAQRHGDADRARQDF
jgi:hypothetical protein